MTLEEGYREVRTDVLNLDIVGAAFAGAREEAKAEKDPAKAVAINAQISRALHAHQANQLAAISRQLLWLQRAVLEHWHGVVEEDD